MVMNAIVLGAGMVGSVIAEDLAESGAHEVEEPAAGKGGAAAGSGHGE